MAGTLLQTPVNGAVDYTDFLTQMEIRKRGMFNIDFTTMADGATAPEIAAGSSIEVSNNIYQFGTQEAATGWGGIANSTEAWMKVVPAGTSITAEFTDTTPTFNELKIGWYDSDDRYVLSVLKDGSGEYTRMGIMPVRQSIWDKNGREVISLIVETKQNTTGYTVAAGADQIIPVAGFSFTPKAVWSAMVIYGVVDNTEYSQVSYPGTVREVAGALGIEVVINGITFDTVNDEVDISIRNNQGSNIYVEQVIVTASG